MSPEAIDRRLAKLSQLYAAWKVLGPRKNAVDGRTIDAGQTAEQVAVERKARE